MHPPLTPHPRPIHIPSCAPIQAVLTIAFGSACLFVSGAARYHWIQYITFFLLFSMTLGVGLGGAYHMPNRCAAQSQTFAPLRRPDKGQCLYG